MRPEGSSDYIRAARPWQTGAALKAWALKWASDPVAGFVMAGIAGASVILVRPELAWVLPLALPIVVVARRPVAHALLLAGAFGAIAACQTIGATLGLMVGAVFSLVLHLGGWLGLGPPGGWMTYALPAGIWVLTLGYWRLRRPTFEALCLAAGWAGAGATFLLVLLLVDLRTA